MVKKPTKNQDKDKEVETTGHEWDGIQEYNNPMPRWWVWTFYVTIVWAVGYTIAYPAWPLIKGATPGLLGWSTRADVVDEIQRFTDMNATLEAELASADLTALEQGSDLHNFAIQSGSATFATHCSQCHGSGAAGAVGYSNLLDDDWLWGGDIEAIHTTVSYGIRATGEDDTRMGDMPAHDWLEAEQVEQMVDYVLSLSGDGGNTVAIAAGAVLFEEEGCAGCHGDNAAGIRELGAPNLTDAIWLYGGGRDAIIESIVMGRAGEMPDWNDKLSESQIAAVSAYVHQLGGGE